MEDPAATPPTGTASAPEPAPAAAPVAAPDDSSSAVFAPTPAKSDLDGAVDHRVRRLLEGMRKRMDRVLGVRRVVPGETRRRVPDAFRPMRRFFSDEAPDDIVRPTVGTQRVRNKRLRVLFVCNTNAARSILAEAYAQRYGFDAESAGTFPAKRIQGDILQVLEEDGIDVSTWRPRVLDESRLHAYDRVITFGDALLQALRRRARTEEWNLPDPTGFPIQGYRQLRKQVQRKVKALAKEMLVKRTIAAAVPEWRHPS